MDIDTVFSEACMNGHLRIAQWLMGQFPYIDDDNIDHKKSYSQKIVEYVEDAEYTNNEEYKEDDDSYIESDESDECIICCKNINDTNKHILLCTHFFHYQCISKWFKTAKEDICPLCKQDMNELRKQQDSLCKESR